MAGDWIRTRSGLRFHVLDPNPLEVCINDIAHALSMQCRFVGHVSHFYSVAQHSVIVSEHCSPEDASEAYIGDMSAPLKHTDAMREFRSAELAVMHAICEHFGLSPVEPSSVVVADRRALLTEARDLGLDVTGWYTEHEPYVETLTPWTPAIAEQKFLDRYAELVGHRQMAHPDFRHQADGHYDGGCCA